MKISSHSRSRQIQRFTPSYRPNDHASPLDHTTGVNLGHLNHGTVAAKCQTNPPSIMCQSTGVLLVVARTFVVAKECGRWPSTSVEHTDYLPK
jgi:hypothetical protein